MPSGTIARLLLDKGFGFIRDERGSCGACGMFKCSTLLQRRYNAQRTTIFTTNFPDLPESGLAGSTDLRSKAAAERAIARLALRLLR